MTREKAIEWYCMMLSGMKDCELKEALQMGLDAIKAQEPESECEACMVHYPGEANDD